MKRFWIACVFAVSLCAWSALATEMTGVIADSKCKHTDASAKSIKCTENCIKGGASPVFVNTADSKVYKITNPEKVKDHYGHKVKVDGNVEGESVTIESIESSDSAGQ